MVPILLLIAAMFILIVTLGGFFLMHLRDHEKEQTDAEEFARKLLTRFDQMIDDKLQEMEDEGPD